MFFLRGLVVASVALNLVACSSSSDAPEESGPSFKGTVHPILAQSCSLTACHGSKESNLGIYIPSSPADVHATLMTESPTARGAKFVVPGNPDASYLMMKIDGTQGQLEAKCSGTCGAQMPLDLPVLSDSERAAIRAWILAGAKND
ncbi:hypothetical protein LZC95_30220 [Pendulispora brunnea]|uniref:Cytochrome c domain-containing protein n=1 Tax=Pendulispora brunnea TaxID=2905690 RepID=A0ABZ2JWJ4_9BACT